MCPIFLVLVVACWTPTTADSAPHDTGSSDTGSEKPDPDLVTPYRSIDLGDADAFLVGEKQSDNSASGEALSDVDGDGRADVIVGAWLYDGPAKNSGAAYVFTSVALGEQSLDAAQTKLLGTQQYDYVGGDVANAGDTDADGSESILVHFGWASMVTRVYVIDVEPGEFVLDGTTALAELEVGEEGLWASDGIGDVNGDGFGDVALGVPYTPTSEAADGSVDVYFGPMTGAAAADATLVGRAGSYTGSAVASAGDFDGDGIGDLVVGSVYWDDVGAISVVTGPIEGTIDLEASAYGTWIGDAEDQRVGESVDGAGDYDGDGLDDVIAGAVWDEMGGRESGGAFVVLGGIPSTGAIHDVDVVMIGESPKDQAGASVAGAGDTDGDGFTDVLVGAYGEATGGKTAGATYLVLGPQGGVFDLEMADVKFVGEADADVSGRALTTGGDVDGDGLADVLIDAWGNDRGGPEAGTSYLLLGRDW